MPTKSRKAKPQPTEPPVKKTAFRVRKRVPPASAAGTFTDGTGVLSSRSILGESTTLKATIDDMPQKVQRLHIPPQPISDDRTDRDEQQVARVETLMIKGFADVGHLCAMLGVDDRRQMERYIRRVHARWEQLGAGNDLRRERGEALRRIKVIQQESWVLYQNVDGSDPRAKIVILEGIRKSAEHEERLLGLSEKQIAILNQITKDNPVAMRLRQNRNMEAMSLELLNLFQANRSASDAETVTTPAPITPASEHHSATTAHDGDVMRATDPDPFDHKAEREKLQRVATVEDLLGHDEDDEPLDIEHHNHVKRKGG